MSARPLRWWRCAEAIASRLASPPADVARADAAAYELVRESRLFAAASTLSSTIARAWPSSRVSFGAEWIARRWRGRTLSERIRQAGRSTLIASVAVLLLQETAAPAHHGPFQWALPVALGLGGLCAAVAADPIARAWNAKRGR
jgi:hypothetical protein